MSLNRWLEERLLWELYDAKRSKKEWWYRDQPAWWRCPRCGYLTAEQYILGKENPYECFACHKKSTGWVRDEVGPEDR